MKRITLLLLTVFCLTVVGIPAMAKVIYTNGGPTAVSDFWDIGGTASTSNTFTCTQTSCTPTSLTFYGTAAPFSPGETIQVSITSGENAGIDYGTELSLLPSTAIPCNGLGQCIYTVPVSFLALPSGTFWLNLTEGQPGLAWWEGTGPSQASHTAPGGATIFNIQGEAFTLNGTTTPEPGSFLLLGSGILGLAGVLRRKLIH